MSPGSSRRHASDSTGNTRPTSTNDGDNNDNNNSPEEGNTP
ncbi:hypothetical protein ACIP9H_40385 [Streptomyces sp. NPDC088732]